MAVKLSPFGPKPQFFDSNGDPLSGGLLYFYVAGSSTPQNTYTTSAGTTANANPIVLNSRGEPASQIWFTEDTTYKATLKTSADVEIWSSDNLAGINDTSVSQDEWVGGTTPTYISATSFSVTGDQSTTYHVGRRLKTSNTGGTIYSTVTAVAYSSVTTVTVANDSGSLDSGLSSVFYSLVSSNNPSVSPEMMYRKASAVAAAASTNIWASAGDYLHITGSAAITGFGTAPYAGAKRELIFDSTPTLVPDGTAIVFPGTNGTFTAAANDRAVVRADTTTKMVVMSLMKANGKAINSGANVSPTRQVFTSGTATYTSPTGITRVLVRLIGGGGGGAAQATNGGTAGVATTFGTFTAAGGSGGGAAGGGGGAGGAGSHGDINITGATGQGGATSGASETVPGGNGGPSVFGGCGGGGAGVAAGSNATANSGAGGGGAGSPSAGTSGGGGGAGAYVEKLITSPSATYTYAVGAGGGGGAAGGAAGGSGGSGIVIVDEFYD